MNTFKTGLLMSLLMGLFLVVGALIGGASGMAIAFVIAAGLNLFAYWNSDKMLLRMYGARQVDAASAPDLYHTVETPGGQCASAHAQGFHFRKSAAQCLCHRAQSQPRRCLRHHRACSPRSMARNWRA